MRREILAHRWSRVVTLLATSTGLLFPPAATAEPSDTDVATHVGCHFGFNIVEVPMENVVELVPDGYMVRSDTGGITANVVIDPFECESVTVRGTTEPVAGAFVSVDICSSEADNPFEELPPTDHDCVESELPYLLFLLTDSRAYAEWVGADTGLDVTYVPDLVHDFACPPDPCETGGYSFDAPEPGPAPFFAVNGVVGAQENLAVPIADGGGWVQETRGPDGSRWAVTLTYNRHFDFFAPADVTITSHAESQMAQLMDTTKAKPILSLPHWIETFDLEKTVTRS